MRASSRSKAVRSSKSRSRRQRCSRRSHARTFAESAWTKSRTGTSSERGLEILATSPVELIVNGYPVETKEITADGSVQDLDFELTPERSSWVALRIFPSAHTNPIFVEVDGRPIRPSKRSAQWCLDAVDVCWNAKREQIREDEREAAKAAYDRREKGLCENPGRSA